MPEEIYRDPETYVEKRYSSTGGRKVLERQNRNFEELLEGLGAEPGDSVLELGSGPALLSEYLDEYDSVGADIEQEPLQVAVDSGRVEDAVRVDAHRLPFRDDAFDYVVAPRLFHLVGDEEDVVDEMNRVAEEGFVFDVFSESSGRKVYNNRMSKHSSYMPADSTLHSDEEVESWLEGLDFEVQSDFPIPFGAYRESESELFTDAVEKMQDAFSGSLDSVVYFGVESE
ncbi:class I SAM-dependent methyltransferase [Candidatus Nanohalovita haloferacivicina]|uniref:class I SAM-dependent methyltransferase n=1 Tax=Candidatus Nanohalovita haloferacivicina TaxID=2978046 RepID=UPI00325F976D|nr:SAM-dependent methyltransferase [Candidatus Nanohalobia archaeon BNXNv]